MNQAISVVTLLSCSSAPATNYFGVTWNGNHKLRMTKYFQQTKELSKFKFNRSLKGILPVLYISSEDILNERSMNNEYEYENVCSRGQRESFFSSRDENESFSDSISHIETRPRISDT